MIAFLITEITKRVFYSFKTLNYAKYRLYIQSPKILVLEHNIKKINYILHNDIIKKWRQQRNDVYFGFQTNATLIDDKWIDFFDSYREIVGISISLDGSASANSNRVRKDGKSTFHNVIHALEELERRNLTASSPFFPYNIYLRLTAKQPP